MALTRQRNNRFLDGWLLSAIANKILLVTFNCDFSSHRVEKEYCVCSDFAQGPVSDCVSLLFQLPRIITSFVIIAAPFVIAVRLEETGKYYIMDESLWKRSAVLKLDNNFLSNEHHAAVLGMTNESSISLSH